MGKRECCIELTEMGMVRLRNKLENWFPDFRYSFQTFKFGIRPTLQSGQAGNLTFVNCGGLRLFQLGNIRNLGTFERLARPEIGLSPGHSGPRAFLTDYKLHFAIRSLLKHAFSHGAIQLFIEVVRMERLPRQLQDSFSIIVLNNFNETIKEW